jgi:hypothetical protein
MRYLLLAAVAALAPAASYGAESAFKATETGTPKIQSIQAIAFGPAGALLIGDGAGAQVVAIDTKDTTAKPWKAKAIDKFDEAIAEKLGTTAKNVEIQQMAVNPASGTAYLAVRKQDEKKTVLLTVDGDGKIGEVSLENVAYVAVPLPKVESSKSNVNRITDVAWAKDRILVGAASNEEFGSKVYTIPTPLGPKNKASGYSVETYHVAHGKWETKAPMSTIVPYESGGKQYVVGAFVCTPVVRYSLDKVKPGEKVKGESVVELGHGNQPRQMFTYKKGDKSYLLVSSIRRFHKRQPIGPSEYWVARVDMDLLDEKTKINEDAHWRVQPKTVKHVSDKIKVVEAYHGTVHIDKLDDKQAVVIKKDAKTGWTLTALELP